MFFWDEDAQRIKDLTDKCDALGQSIEYSKNEIMSYLTAINSVLQIHSNMLSDQRDTAELSPKILEILSSLNTKTKIEKRTYNKKKKIKNE